MPPFSEITTVCTARRSHLRCVKNRYFPALWRFYEREGEKKREREKESAREVGINTHKSTQRRDPRLSLDLHDAAVHAQGEFTQIKCMGIYTSVSTCVLECMYVFANTVWSDREYEDFDVRDNAKMRDICRSAARLLQGCRMLDGIKKQWKRITCFGIRF